MGFKAKGISTAHSDVKYFEEKKVALMDLINMPLTIIDFQGGIKTCKGENRYCILAENCTTGEKVKFFTTSKQLTDTLDEARKAHEQKGDIFPVEGVVIRRKNLGEGHACFYFDEYQQPQ